MQHPDWFIVSESITPEIWKRVGAAVGDCGLPVQYNYLPLQAYWFFVSSLTIAHDANRGGLHANALANTRLCIECLSIIEIGLCRAEERTEQLSKWKKGDASPGYLRKWLSQNVWSSYGKGLWDETWSEFSEKLARAVQPYAHFTELLAQWQSKLHSFDSATNTALMEIGPKLYDPQKASRITLYHSLLWHSLARAYLASSEKPDRDFASQVEHHRQALGASRYLDGHKTDWDQQFWAMLWNSRTGRPFEE